MSSNENIEDEILKCPECGENNFFRIQHFEDTIILKKVGGKIEIYTLVDRDLDSYYYDDNGAWVCRTCDKEVCLEEDSDGEKLVIND